MNVSITPGQRRGAAAALRSLGRTTLPVVAIVGTVADAYGGRPDASPVESLADLVDWPTCRIGYVPGSADRSCSACGVTFSTGTYQGGDHEEHEFMFCPNCGAEVVGDAQ